MAELHVELVAADHEVWSGAATMVIATTVDGDIGILPGHAPLLGVLPNGTVQIRTGSQPVVAAVLGGFISMADDRVSILAEVAELADEIDVEGARREIEQARSSGDDEEFRATVQRAEARLRAAGQAP